MLTKTDREGLGRWVNEYYLEPEVIEGKRREFKKARPFPHLELKNFLLEDKAELIMHGLATERFFEKQADLFSMKQTNDLASSNSESLLEVRRFLMSKPFVSLLRELTGLKLKTGKIDLHGSLYESTDFLLCHDDRLEGRKLAFLHYLSDFKLEDGGALALKNENLDTTRRILPKYNTFAFFEVSPTSYHEVEEVIADKQRVAIGGWYHGQ